MPRANGKQSVVLSFRRRKSTHSSSNAVSSIIPGKIVHVTIENEKRVSKLKPAFQGRCFTVLLVGFRRYICDFDLVPAPCSFITDISNKEFSDVLICSTRASFVREVNFKQASVGNFPVGHRVHWIKLVPV